MKEILDDFLSQQATVDPPFAVTIVLATGEKVTGIIEGTSDGYVSITRRVEEGRKSHTDDEYADLMRHYRIRAVIGAYYTEGS
jgi:hypothetical protein